MTGSIAALDSACKKYAAICFRTVNSVTTSNKHTHSKASIIAAYDMLDPTRHDKSAARKAEKKAEVMDYYRTRVLNLAA